MKKQLISIMIIFSMIFISCGQSSKVVEKQNYTPASVKYQPRLLYPKTAQERAYTGNAKMILNISKAGEVKDVRLVESSGYEILDNAGIEYCKNMIFIPAQSDGKAINTKMEWEIDFNILPQDWDPYFYIRSISKLYLDFDRSDETGRNDIENEIFEKHNEFVQNMRDSKNFNSFIEQVVSPDLVAEWKNEWDEWPLSFLLYHDFINRFGDFDSLANVKAQLLKSVNSDIQFIKKSTINDLGEEEEIGKILRKIDNFISSKYPSLS